LAAAATAAAAANGELIRVKEIRLYGARYTSARVIRHYLEVREGDILTQKELDEGLARSRRNLENTQFFSRVNIFDLPRKNPREAVIMVDLAEGTTWRLAASTRQVRLSKANMGGAARTLGAEFGLDRQRVFFEQPWLFDRKLVAAAGAFFENGRLIETEAYHGPGERFRYESVGGDASLGYIITLRANAGLGVLAEDLTYYDTHIKATPWPRYGVQSHARLVALTPYLEWDARDDTLYPTRGFWFRIQGEGATAAVGDYEYAGGKLETRGYFSPAWKVVAAQRLIVGATSARTPYIRWFDISGGEGLRNAISRRVVGTTAALYTAELRRYLFPSPWFSAWFEGVAFFDAGRTWDAGEPVDVSGFDYAFGPGLRLHMRNPLIFDWRAELDVNQELAFYATARAAF